MLGAHLISRFKGALLVGIAPKRMERRQLPEVATSPVVEPG